VDKLSWINDYKFQVKNCDNAYAVSDGTTGKIVHSNSNLVDAITFAMDNLSPGRNWKETILLKVTGSITKPIFVYQRSYIRFILRGHIQPINGIGQFTHPNGGIYEPHIFWVEQSFQIELDGGHLDGNKTYYDTLPGGDSNLRAINPILITNQASQIKIRNVECKNYTNFGITVYDADRVDVENCFVHDGWQTGIAIESWGQSSITPTRAERVRIIGNRIKDIGQVDRDKYEGPDPFGETNRNGIHFEGFFNTNRNETYRDPATGDIVTYFRNWASHPWGCIVDGNIVEGVGKDYPSNTLKSTGNAINSNAGFHLLIKNNICINGRGQGITLFNSKSCMISNNQIFDCAKENTPSYNNGMMIDDSGVVDPSGQGSFENIIMSNRIRQHGGYALDERNVANRNLIHGNNGYNNTSGGFRTIGSSTLNTDNIN